MIDQLGAKGSANASCGIMPFFLETVSLYYYAYCPSWLSLWLFKGKKKEILVGTNGYKTVFRAI